MTEQTVAEPLAAGAAAPVAAAHAAPAEPQAPVLDDPLAGIPAEVLDRVGAADRDTAGGCG